MPRKNNPNGINTTTPIARITTKSSNGKDTPASDKTIISKATAMDRVEIADR